MRLPPAVIVHSLPHIRTALATALPVTLLSAPGAALSAGCLWWRELLGAAGFAGFSFLDCADAPGRALEALKLGLMGVVLTCEPLAFAIVAEIAAAQNALLLPAAPAAVDLSQRGAERRLAAWLDVG